MMKSIALPETLVELSTLCLGNGVFGTGVPLDRQDEMYATFRRAGGTSFDTAHCYCFWLPGGAGASERELGDCIRRHGDAGKVQILTKGGHPDGGPKYPRPDLFLAPEVISRDIADSLERLRMGSIDLYFLHRDDRRMPVGELMGCLNEHLCAGRLRAAGCVELVDAAPDRSQPVCGGAWFGRLFRIATAVQSRSLQCAGAGHRSRHAVSDR